jgi:eukaryotic-like serine/threonine-protein kinase
MPALDQQIVTDLTARVGQYIQALGGYSSPEYIASGGSAALYRVESASGVRAIKAFNPALFTVPGQTAERRRLDVQKRLIGHECPSLVQTYRVEEALGTAFLEMEFVPWLSLKTQLAEVPDDAVPNLFAQLVSAVRFLDTQAIVHRDVKPENIHVSPDFKSLKLLDLGVARESDLADGEEAAITDHGNLRPFLATAQYSSPEYLFRLDEPDIKLWKGLTFYQLGAVLHDLIMKRPLFDHEMGLGNRWLVARAVLTKVPDFTDGEPTRLADLKALATRCLVKNLDARLQLVGWQDFILEGAKNPLIALRARLAKGKVNPGGEVDSAKASRLDFDRAEFMRRFTEAVRADLLPSCGTSLPLYMKPSAPGEAPPHTRFVLTVDKHVTIECVVRFEWQDQLYDHMANIAIQARILCTGHEEPAAPPHSRLIAATTTDANEMTAATSVANAIAIAAGSALDLIEGSNDLNLLHGLDLQQEPLGDTQ